MTREELHQLVDTLPEAALEPAKQSLQYFQIWPRVPPPEVERMHREHQERMRRKLHGRQRRFYSKRTFFLHSLGGKDERGRDASLPRRPRDYHHRTAANGRSRKDAHLCKSDYRAGWESTPAGDLFRR